MESRNSGDNEEQPDEPDEESFFVFNPSDNLNLNKNVKTQIRNYRNRAGTTTESDPTQQRIFQ